MRLNKLIFQGVFGQSSPLRIDFGEGCSRPALPSRVPIGGLRNVLVTLLYPDACTDEELATLGEASDPQVAVLFEYRERTFRVARRASRRSVQLHLRKQGGFQTAAKGTSEVSEILDGRLGRPAIEEFRALNLWQFDRAAGEREEDAAVDPEAIGPEAVQMLDEYEKTLEIDEVEEQLEKTRKAIERLRNRFGEGFEIEEKLERARERRREVRTPKLTDDQYDLLEQREERVEEYRSTLHSLEEDESGERDRVRNMEPMPPWRDRFVWGGMAVGVAAMAVSLAKPEALRWAALFDIVGFGVVAWTFLKYLTDLEEVNIHKVRIESIKRRSAEVREEMAEFREEVDHLLVHEDAESPEELLERRRRVERLDEQIDKLERRSEELSNNEKFQKATERIESLKSELRRLEARREELPEYGADLFQLENELHALGIDPEAALRARRGDEPAQESGRPFVLLRDLAVELECWERGQLEGKTRKLWQRMAEHALGGDFGEVQLEGDGSIGGGLPVEGTERDQWLEKHPDERRVLAGTLALALHIRTLPRDGCVETVVLEDPQDAYPAAISRRLIEVFQGLAKRGHVAVFESGG